jgi:predicted Zn-dependent peptidase
MGVEVSRLKNGVVVATHALPHLESVALGLWVGAGARSEAADEHGVSHLLEHMAFKGTKRRSAQEIAESIEAVGGEMNAETGVDHTVYYVRLLKDDVGLGMDVLGDIVADPLLDPDELALEQHVIIQEIGAAHDVPEDLVFDMFQQAAYPGQAIGRSVLGTPESIRMHTPDRLRRFLDTHYCGPQMVVSAAGNLEHQKILGLAEEHFAGLPDRPPTAPEAGAYRGGEAKEERFLQETQILLGFAAPCFTDPQFAAAHVFSAILGGGMASRPSRSFGRSGGFAIPSPPSTGRLPIPVCLGFKRPLRRRISAN